MFDHPKFGLIPCISTIADIEEGEEVIKTIFYSSLPQTYYNMKNEFSDTISLEHRSLWGTGTTWRSPPSGTSWPGSTASSGRRASSTRTGWSAPSENQSLHSVLTGARSFGLCTIQNKLPRVQWILDQFLLYSMGTTRGTCDKYRVWPSLVRIHNPEGCQLSSQAGTSRNTTFFCATC